MLLYPRLPAYVARELAEERSSFSVEDLRNLSQPAEHPAAWYAPTGGQRIGRGQLISLQEGVRNLAQAYGYPASPDLEARGGFDSSCASFLHKEMEISASEGAMIGVWWFMTCVLLPDIVRWRFPGDEGTARERFVGSSRGMRRNAFGRLWWRAHLLRDSALEDPYRLLELLTEDELVQITERPSLAGSPSLARSISHSLIWSDRQFEGDMSRRDLLRDSIKRIRRLYSMLSFDVLDDQELSNLVEAAFARSASMLGGSIQRDVVPTYQSTPNVTPGQPVEPANEMRVFDSEMTWQDLLGLGVGEGAWLSGRETKRVLNRLLSREGFKGTYLESERSTEWSNGTVKFIVLHEGPDSDEHRRSIRRLA